jgi:hypothetical protein
LIYLNADHAFPWPYAHECRIAFRDSGLAKLCGRDVCCLLPERYFSNLIAAAALSMRRDEDGGSHGRDHRHPIGNLRPALLRRSGADGFATGDLEAADCGRAPQAR